MAVPKQLGFGRTGWQGDESVSLRSTLQAERSLINDIKAQHNALLLKLDADGDPIPGAGVPSTDYAASLAAVSSNVVTAASEHIAAGGAYTHGDDAVRLRTSLNQAVVLAAELVTQHNLLLVKLDGDSLGFITYVANFTVTLTSLGDIPGYFGQGSSATHGDQAVRVRQALETINSGQNDIKAQHNALLVQLDADAVVNDIDYAATVGVTAANA